MYWYHSICIVFISQYFLQQISLSICFTWILSLWGQIFALISGKCYLIGLVFYPPKDIQSSHNLYRFLFCLTKFISEIYRNLEAPQPQKSQAYLITLILDNSAESVPKNWEWVSMHFTFIGMLVQGTITYLMRGTRVHARFFVHIWRHEAESDMIQRIRELVVFTCCRIRSQILWL